MYPYRHTSLLQYVLIMKISKERFEVGIQRLYYVLWVAWGIFLVGINSGKALEQTSILSGLVFLALLGVVGPFLLMHATRWIYRGFFPKE